MEEDPGGVETRDSILKIIQETKAIHKSQLCRQVGCAWGTVGYHLKHLRQADLVRTEVKGRLLWVYPADLGAKERNQARVMAEENAQEVFEAVRTHPGTTIRELDQRLNLPTKVIRRHLHRMTSAHLLEREGQRPQRFRALAERWRKY